MASFGKLLRFKNVSGQILYGEVKSLDKITYDTIIGATVPVYDGEDPWAADFKLSGREETVSEVLAPLARVPIFLCIGLNYKKHAEEGNMKVGDDPQTFYKPADALAGPYDDIPINPACQWMDYEVELCVVIGKDCKNIREDEDVTQYILGYTVGNDVSSRWWQMPERSSNQPSAAKSFDKFAPIGPVITSPSLIPDPTKLKMRSIVNGQQRQITQTDDLIFDIPTIIRHFSRGMTIRKGTVIMTGTPSGVAAFMKPPAWLQDGDVVEMELENVGTMRNKMVFER
ncbi:uncharacterized protein Z519_08610 [Cladophialophora bantiana CBS 173.52]|uniref:Fumarylacetoacetase-like C-terminal domain-containing protein n=1 Tax=Cladophialophora bantiana (strain ATCC 10958 / CBS 173.52 / CDC B-1940 / NIH 8579) TaxID=1442370 RepID=A0A0D2FWC0_CLAB1|nr:uncharacterized protein Z519_08610 [Cladophialophora bantiana CBS 173.52]KIW90827.1 hypothetical protein Z519_08610 [Cladophialophora bantiana CBS 173.52]